MGEYVLNSLMLSIPLGGVDVVLGFQWIKSFGAIAFNIQECFLKPFWKGKEVELTGIVGKSGKIISSNSMTNLLKKNNGA